MAFEVTGHSPSGDDVIAHTLPFYSVGGLWLGTAEDTLIMNWSHLFASNAIVGTVERAFEMWTSLLLMMGNDVKKGRGNKAHRCKSRDVYHYFLQVIMALQKSGGDIKIVITRPFRDTQILRTSKVAECMSDVLCHNSRPVS